MTLLGGYLGAGKTTIVNHVLAAAGEEGRRIAVLVNDLGTVQVDAALIAARHDDTIELANGCICCSLVDGLAVALETLRDRPKPPDHVLVELSGVAEPARVVPWASTAGFRLDGVVVAADADQIRDRSTDPRLAGLVDAQLAAADLLGLTKLDLLDDDIDAADLLAWLAARTDAPVVPVVAGDIPAEVLLGPYRMPGGSAASEAATAARPAGDPIHVQASVTPRRMTPTELRSALEELDGVVRAKGVVDSTEGAMLVQLVGRRVEVEPHEAMPSVLTLIALDQQALDAAVHQLGAGIR